MQIIAILIGAVVLFFVQQELYRRLWAENLSVDLSLSDDKSVECQELILFETITNKKLLPLPMLKVKFITSKYFIFEDSEHAKVTDQYYRNDLLPVMMYQKLTRSLPFLCSHRGYFTIKQMDIVCCDIFLTFEAVNLYPVDIRLYVYPRLVESNRFQILFQKMLGTVLTRRFINEDPFEFRAIREYQSYDTLKSVNWKASAKTGTLKVNVHDATSSQQIKIFLNLESETNRIEEDIIEESIRIAATFAGSFIGQGIPTAVYTNGRDIVTKKIINITAGSGTNHTQNIMEVLARIDNKLGVPNFVPVIQEELLKASENDYVILVSSYQREDLQNLLSLMQSQKSEFTWIVPLEHGGKIKVNDQLAACTIPWEMES
ncbi:MAG: DUF58 domain-containing protein [Mobilitalea sp.]